MNLACVHLSLHTVIALLKKVLIPCLLVQVSLVLLACDRSEVARYKGTKALAEEFRIASQADTVEPMLALYALEGTEKQTIRMLKEAIEYELNLPISSIQFEPLTGAPEERIDYVHDGVAYGPSLEPRLRMRVLYALEDQFTSLYTVGQLPDGTWRIVCARPIVKSDFSAAIAPR